MKTLKQKLYIEFETENLEEVKTKLKEYNDWTLEEEKHWVEDKKDGRYHAGKILLTKIG